jgi:N-acetylglucosaminyl-diphospho-decaprenol L-rhamnosyltransferase
VAQAHQHFSAVVVSFQTGPTLDVCLKALINAPLCSQIVLVNNGNPPDVLDKLRSLTAINPKLTLIDGHGNIGFGRGCNYGADFASADNLVFVNPDCILDEGTLAAFGDVLTTHPSALLGGALRNEDGSEQRGCRRGDLTLWSAFVSFSGLGKPGMEAGMWRDFNRNGEPFPTETVAIPVVSGALMASKREAFDKIGGFDATYFLHVEDIDLCARVRSEGQAVLFVPNATALHVGGTSQASNWVVTSAKINSFAHYFWTRARGIVGKLVVLATMPLLAVAILLRSFLR